MNFYTTTNQTISLAIIVLGTIIAITLPFASSISMRAFRRAPIRRQSHIWVTGVIGLSVVMFAQFIYAFAVYVFCAGTVSPYLWEMDPLQVSLDAKLTMRHLLFWLTPIVATWLLFRYGGLYAIRDMHKTIKEQGDVIYARKAAVKGKQLNK